MSQIALEENRETGDRRRRPTPMFSRFTLVGRRTGARRAGEGAGTYVDRYGPSMIAILLAIFSLCVLDAIFTLLYIQAGGGELNPFMALAIEAGVLPFFLVKCGMTLPGIAFLCIHKNFRCVKAILLGVLLVYTVLLAYHLYLRTLI